MNDTDHSISLGDALETVRIFVYLHLVKKPIIVRWIAKYIFREQLMSEKSAENLFNVATSFIVTIGGLWVVLAIYYIANAYQV